MRATLCLLLLSFAACSGAESLEQDDGADDVAVPDGKTDALGYSDCELREVLSWLDAGATASELRAAGVGSRARRAILAHRDGPDAIFGTADDDLFDDLAELDAVRYVGPITLRRLVDAMADRCVEDPRLAMLRNPDRLSLLQECQYGDMSLDELAGAFTPGSDQLPITFPWERYRMTCDASGCEPLTGGEFDVPSSYKPELRLTAEGEVEINGDTWQRLPATDHIFTVDGVPYRLRATTYPVTGRCISLVRYDASLTSYDVLRYGIDI